MTINTAELMEAIVREALGGFIVVDPQGIVIFINKAYEEFLGKKAEDVLGKHITSVLQNTRLHEVAKTGIPEFGVFQKQSGKYLCGHRIPIFKDGKVIAVMGQLVFHNSEEMQYLIDQLNNLSIKLDYYKEELHNLWSPKHTLDTIIGHSKEISYVRRMARKAAASNTTVLIQGETGVGKEIFAHAIHSASSRKDKPFIKVNCAAIPHDLLESELFGYEEGAFTGARKKGKPGKFELAHEGSIFLDEIGDMPLPMQAKLLRVIQEKELERIGGVSTIAVDVRIIAATNQNLEELVKTGRFRSDLYYRLNVIPVVIPPLRQRKEDIPEFIEFALQKMAQQTGHKPVFSEEAMEALCNYHWPGNVRELFNVVERIVSLHEGEVIEKRDLPAAIRGKRPRQMTRKNLSLKEYLEEAEKEAITIAMQEAKGNKNLAAQILGIHRITLYEKLKKYSL